MTRSVDISPLSVLLSRVDGVADGAPSRDTVASGFPSLDKMLGGGFRLTDLVVLGGDIGSGKSALALAMAVRASGLGKRVAILSGEMTTERILERILAIEARARLDELRLGTLDDVTRASAGAAALRLRDRLPMIERLPEGAGVPPVAALLDTLGALDLIVIDPLSTLARAGHSLDEEEASIIRELKTLALNRGLAILTTAPLPELAARADRRPTLDDFGALGCIKQQADIVLGLFRQDMYEPSRDIEGATELLIRKNRNGATGYVDLYFYAQWMRFEDMLDPDR
jgi:replicative DNA helicase